MKLPLYFPPVMLALLFIFAQAPHASPPEDCEVALEKHVTKNFIGAKVATFASAEYRPEMENSLRTMGTDLLRISAPSIQEQRELITAHGFFYVPPKISWKRKTMEVEAWLATLNSKDRGRFRAKLKKSEGQVRVEFMNLTVADFERWYQIYNSEVAGKDRGRSVISADWATTKGDELKKYERLFFIDRTSGALLGGVLLRGNSAGTSYQAPYAAYLGSHRYLELATRAFYEVMNRAVSEGYDELSYGVDSNLYGHHLSVGLMEYKSSLGFLPAPDKDRELLKILNPAILNNDYFFFALGEDGKLTGHQFSVEPRNLVTPDGVPIVAHALESK